MTFVGGKNGAGTYQRIINLIPPHRVYIEPFVGTGAILRHKRPAGRSVAIDLDPGAIDALADGPACRLPQLELIVGDGVEYLRHSQLCSSPDTFVYADPPYVRSSRRDPGRDYYDHEWTDADHERFCKILKPLTCRTMVSGYSAEPYASQLVAPRWWATTYTATTRGGPATETLWTNYRTPPHFLHDYRYLGETYPDRWRIHKRQRSWLRMLAAMPPLERRAMLAAVVDANSDDVLDHLNAGPAAGMVPYRPPRR